MLLFPKMHPICGAVFAVDKQQMFICFYQNYQHKEHNYFQLILEA